MANKKTAEHVHENLADASKWLSAREGREYLPLVHPAHWLIADTVSHFLRGTMIRYVYRIDITTQMDGTPIVKIFHEDRNKGSDIYMRTMYEIQFAAFVQIFKKASAEAKLRKYGIKLREEV